MKTLLYDIETSPLITYSWQIWEADAIEVIDDFQILCFAYKWLGDKSVKVLGQDDLKGYKPGINDDEAVVRALWELFNEADVVIAHNGDAFDQKVSQARMITHGLPPPAPYRQIDTKKVAKKHGRFTSNKLDHLGKGLGLGQKLDTGGFKIWKGCLAGDKQSWAKMKKYNKQDVVLLEQLYLHLLPWIDNHPSVAVFDGIPDGCRNCGSQNIRSGSTYRATNANLYKYYRCGDCGTTLKSRIAEPKTGVKYA